MVASVCPFCNQRVGLLKIVSIIKTRLISRVDTIGRHIERPQLSAHTAQEMNILKNINQGRLSRINVCFA